MFLYITILLSAFVGPARADFSVGGSFAAPGYGARAWGMGGAAIASIADEGAVYWNPAMLGLVGGHNFGIAYANLIPGVDARQSYLAYAQPIKLGSADEPGLEYALHAVGAIYGNLVLELADGQSYSENILRISYAYTPLYFVSIGVSFAGLLTSSDIPNFGGKGTALDVGLRLALTREFTFAFVVRNVISQLSFEDGTDFSLPRAVVFGIAYRPMANLVFEGDLESKYGGLSRAILGGEYTVYNEVLAVRAGAAALASGENRSVPYLGAGVRFGGFHFDYAVDFDMEEAFDNSQRVSLGLEF